MAAKAKTDTLTLKPSEFKDAIRYMMLTDRAMFGWGPPGVAKSDASCQVATEANIAFIDVRLSQMDPTDLRGMPYPTKIGGEDGVRWSTPFQLPRDLDTSQIITADAEDTVTIHVPNPVGKNNIHYVTAPEFAVKAITKGTVAVIIEQTPDRAVVALFKADANGEPTDEFALGKFRFTAKGKARAILGLEEFNSAPPSVQAAAYQLVLDRALGEYRVPKGVYIIGLGNRETDRGITFKMPTPIMNRFVHIEVRVDFDDWQTWALGAKVHPDVVGYLTAFKDQLFQFEPGSAARGFATPRSWHFVSDIVTANPDMSEQVGLGLICGAVGDGSGIQFMEHRRHAADLPHSDDILNGRLKKMPRKVEVALAYALTTTLCYTLKERADDIIRKNRTGWLNSPERKKWLEQADNFLEFMMSNFQPEICILGAKAAISVHKLPFDTQRMKHFDPFCDAYKDFILS
jgi:MoxR-like ATPase